MPQKGRFQRIDKKLGRGYSRLDDDRGHLRHVLLTVQDFTYSFLVVSASSDGEVQSWHPDACMYRFLNSSLSCKAKPNDSSTHLVANMIRVWSLSAEELAAVDMGEFSDVTTMGSLRRHLGLHYGLPVCVHQLVKDGCRLDNEREPSTPCDVQLVLQPCSSVS